MKVLVAGQTAGGQTQVGVVQVLVLDGGTVLRGDVRGSVALVAGQSSVFAF